VVLGLDGLIHHCALSYLILETFHQERIPHRPLELISGGPQRRTPQSIFTHTFHLPERESIVIFAREALAALQSEPIKKHASLSSSITHHFTRQYHEIFMRDLYRARKGKEKNGKENHASRQGKGNAWELHHAVGPLHGKEGIGGNIGKKMATILDEFYFCLHLRI
jgi:hypothetical protein